MVERQIEARESAIRGSLDAMLRYSRESSSSLESIRHLSYEDEPVSIGFGQTISQPYMTALMAECLESHGRRDRAGSWSGLRLSRRRAGSAGRARHLDRDPPGAGRRGAKSNLAEDRLGRERPRGVRATVRAAARRRPL